MYTEICTAESTPHPLATAVSNQCPTILAAPRREGGLSKNVGVAFDLEGTTVNLEEFRHGGHLIAAHKLGLVIRQEEAVSLVEHFIGGPDEKVGEDLYQLTRSTLPKREFVQEFLALTREAFEHSMLNATIRPRDGVIEMIDWLRGRNLPFSIGSLTEREQAFMIIRRSGLDTLFGEKVLVREDVLNLKPAPDIYLKTAEVMRVSPLRQVVFDDSPRGITAAITAGSTAIGMPVIRQPEALAALERAHAHRIFTDWRDPELKEYVAKLIDELGAN